MPCKPSEYVAMKYVVQLLKEVEQKKEITSERLEGKSLPELL